MNSISESLTKDSLISSVIQTFRNPVNKGKVLVALEGQDDVNMYEDVFSSTVTILDFLKSKAYFPAVFTAVNEFYPNRFMGICDADFENLDSVRPDFANIFFTDGHDTEILSLAIGCGEDMCNLYGVPIPEQGVFEFVCNSVKEISFIKWYNHEICKAICFDGMHPDPYIQDDNSINMTSYWSKLKLHPANASIDFDEAQVAAFVSGKKIDFDQITNGHDAYRYLYQYIRRVNNGKNIKRTTYDTLYAQHFNIEKFKNTQLFLKISAWADSVGIPNIFKEDMSIA
ncbi:MAG: DUF4435 domain-containing protein [Bacteroidales bacterium]|nr:DUF4435 domain-containing protein [Bacteroidales bacterium]